MVVSFELKNKQEIGSTEQDAPNTESLIKLHKLIVHTKTRGAGPLQANRKSAAVPTGCIIVASDQSAIVPSIEVLAKASVERFVLSNNENYGDLASKQAVPAKPRDDFSSAIETVKKNSSSLFA